MLIPPPASSEAGRPLIPEAPGPPSAGVRNHMLEYFSTACPYLQAFFHLAGLLLQFMVFLKYSVLSNLMRCPYKLFNRQFFCTIFVSFYSIFRVCFKTIKVTKRGYRQDRQQRENRVLSSHTWWQNGGCFSALGKGFPPDDALCTCASLFSWGVWQ